MKGPGTIRSPPRRHERENRTLRIFLGVDAGTNGVFVNSIAAVSTGAGTVSSSRIVGMVPARVRDARARSSPPTLDRRRRRRWTTADGRRRGEDARARARVGDANDVESLRARVGVARGKGTARDDVGTRRRREGWATAFRARAGERGMDAESV